VVELGSAYGLRVIRHWVPIPIKELRENSSYYPVRRIGLHSRREIGTVIAQNWRGGEALFQPRKGLSAILCPHKGNVIPRQIVQRSSNSTKLSNKSSIEITKSQKRLNSFHCSGYSPISNDFCFAGVGFNPVRGDNESEVFCSLDVKFTFVNRRLQPCLTQFI